MFNTPKKNFFEIILVTKTVGSNIEFFKVFFIKIDNVHCKILWFKEIGRRHTIVMGNSSLFNTSKHKLIIDLKHLDEKIMAERAPLGPPEGSLTYT